MWAAARSETGLSTFPDCIGEELTERADVSLRARSGQRGHISVPTLYPDDGPGIASRSKHGIHQESAHAPVSIHVGVDVDEEEVPQYGPNCRRWLLGKKGEQRGHHLAYRVTRGWDVTGISDVHGPRSVTREIGSLEQTSLDAATPSLTGPTREALGNEFRDGICPNAVFDSVRCAKGPGIPAPSGLG